MPRRGEERGEGETEIGIEEERGRERGMCEPKGAIDTGTGCVLLVVLVKENLTTGEGGRGKVKGGIEKWGFERGEVALGLLGALVPGGGEGEVLLG